MSRSPDIIFMAEYIKNVLYFAVVRTGKILKSTNEIHYFTIDNELLYENYYSDFGPLNLGCVYKYCKLLNDKMKIYLNKQKIVHYTIVDQKKKTNSAFLLGCYGVLYLNLTPKDAFKPLVAPHQNYRPFQDATQGESIYTISIMDCLEAIKKARELGLFNFEDFNYEEYNRLDKIQGGDLNWILPAKFLAFIGPVDYSVSLYHPPEMYIDYFLENKVKIVIRLNKRLYNGKVFNDAGIVHYDLFFPDGSCPPRHILQKFLQISEESEGAIAVHCKAGLGRTGSLIGCYLIKHYRMTAHEAIGWMRICRPGSVIGHQQGWLEKLEAWLLKQGNIYRKRMFNDMDKIPYHEFGVYSIAEKMIGQRPVVFHKSPSPPPPAQTRPNIPISVRPQASKVRDDLLESEDEEVFLTSCDLTVKPNVPMTQLKGCIIKSNTITEEFEGSGSSNEHTRYSLWEKIICCKQCIATLKDAIWTLSVRCAKVSPRICHSATLCIFIDMVAVNKTEKEQCDRRVKSSKMSYQKILLKGEQNDDNTTATRRGSGAGDPRPQRSLSRSSTAHTPPHRNSAKSIDTHLKPMSSFQPTITTFRPSNGPIIKNVNDARKFLIKSSIYNEERDRQLNSSLRVTPHDFSRVSNYLSSPPGNMGNTTPSPFSTVPRTTQPQQRRRLGRSPSPPQIRMSTEKTRATNTPTTEKFLFKDASKSVLSDALSRLKLTTPRDGSIGGASLGAASLGARRDAPAPKQAPSVRSDERPLATQGDMLNSIKFQRRLRTSLHSDNVTSVFSTNKPCLTSKEKPIIKHVNSRTSTGTKNMNQEFCLPRDISGSASRKLPTRPSSPKGRRSTYTPSFF